jgi:hypothetical protein
MLRVGELVCLARPGEVASCQALLAEMSRSPDREPGWRPKWKWSEKGNRIATFYAARAAVFPNPRSGYAFTISDGETNAFSKTFVCETDAMRASALSLFVMRETGSWRQDFRAQEDARLREQIAQYDPAALPKELLQEFEPYRWRTPDGETERAFGWGPRGETRWLPKAVVYATRDANWVLVKAKFTQAHGCPLERAAESA